MVFIVKFITKKLPSVLMGLLLLALMGCKDAQNCITDNTSLLRVAFKSSHTKADTSIVINTVSIVGAHSSRIVLNTSLKKIGKETPLSTSLFLNPHRNSTTFHFERPKSAGGAAITNTLTVFYTTTVSLASPQCGAQLSYTLQSVNTDFSKATIVNPNLTRRIEQLSICLQTFA